MTETIKKISVVAGEPFAISHTQGIGGFVWELREPHDPLNCVEGKSVPNEGIGTGSTSTLTFTAPEPGTFYLWYDQKRPWEDQILETEQYEITVT